MATAGVVIVRYHVLEVLDIEPGHWCPECALPSAAKVVLASQMQIGVELQPLKLSTRLRCSEGHGWIGQAL